MGWGLESKQTEIAELLQARGAGAPRYCRTASLSGYSPIACCILCIAVSTTVLNDWQIEEIKKAVKEADRGDFAADKDVQKVIKKWTRNAE